MSNLEQVIYDCLRMFGPSKLADIQRKLDMRKIGVLSQNEIEAVAETMVERKLIRRADGFDDIAYKV